jgi:hypothetical protein
MTTIPGSNAPSRAKKRPAQAMLIIVAITIALVAGWAGRAVRRPSTGPSALQPLRQQAYVWHRHWDGRVQNALRAHGSNFDQIVVLAAEVAWKGAVPKIVCPPLDYVALRDSGRPIGLAIRLGAYPGRYSTNDSTALGLVRLARGLIETAKANQLHPSELQIDFDCATSKLAGYQQWLTALRPQISPVPLTITALPAWMHRREFADLVRPTDGFVLQVHSLERPRDANSPYPLCDPRAARESVTQANRFGRPFRVALPTYA